MSSVILLMMETYNNVPFWKMERFICKKQFGTCFTMATHPFSWSHCYVLEICCSVTAVLMFFVGCEFLIGFIKVYMVVFFTQINSINRAKY